MIDFSVLIPVYNTKPEHLIEAFNSVKNQTIEQDYKIYLVDDGSTNHDTKTALEIIESYGGIVLRLEENKGTSAALNYGHSVIQSDWIAIMGADDISDSTRFHLQVDFLHDRPTIDVLGSNLFSFYKSDIKRTPIYTSKHHHEPDIKRHGWITNHGTVMYKNQLVKDIGGYNESLRRGQDIDLFKRLYHSGAKIRNLTKILYGWRK